MHSHQLGEKSRHLVFKLFLENYPTCCCEISQVLTHVSIFILSEAFFSATIKKIPDLTVFFVMWLKKEKKKKQLQVEDRAPRVSSPRKLHLFLPKKRMSTEMLPFCLPWENGGERAHCKISVKRNTL